MRNLRQEKARVGNEESADRMVAALIASTLRVRRKLDLLEVANWVEKGSAVFGSLQALSEKVGISAEMLREFVSVNKLSLKVKKLIAQRKIESVDIAYRLSKLCAREQLAVAREVAAGNIDSNDVRGIVSLRRSAPALGIGEIIRRVKTSRNIKEYVAQFLLPPGGGQIENVRRAFAQIVGNENICSLDLKGPLGTVRINKEGKTRLQEAARRRGLTKRQLIGGILDEWVIKNVRVSKERHR